MLTISHTKEALSCAFMTALAAKAGILLNIGGTFDYGIDGHLRTIQRFQDGRHAATGITLDFQLKATVNWTIDPGDEHIVYNVEAKAYNDIAVRGPEENGMVLIVLCLPRDETEWVRASNDNLMLKHCCYWYQVNGGVLPGAEERREAIYIPRQNVLDENSIVRLINDERTRRRGLMR